MRTDKDQAYNLKTGEEHVKTASQFNLYI